MGVSELQVEEITPIWPNPVEIPLYVSVKAAANLAGVSYDTMRAWADSKHDPIPHIRVGKEQGKTLIRTAAIPEYMRKKETR